MKVFRILNIDEKYKDKILEIRVRSNSKIIVYMFENNHIEERFIDIHGNLNSISNFGIEVSQNKLNNIFNALLDYSIENYKDEISKGFITLNDGTRIGITGEVCFDNNKIKSFKKITSLNIRIARHIEGCSSEILKKIIKDKKNIYNTLIVSPPMCGKTTIIRDLALQLSKGNIDIFPMNVGIVDERCEVVINDMLDNLTRIDYISGINKIMGSEILIRTMNPNIIILDEIGLKDDFENLSKVINSGVSFIATMHGGTKLEINRKLNEYEYLFEKIILISKDMSNKKFFKYEVIKNE